MPADLKLSLLGRHQLDNAAAAITAAHVIRDQDFGNITRESVLQGLRETHLPGRMQVSHSIKTCTPHMSSAEDLLVHACCNAYHCEAD